MQLRAQGVVQNDSDIHRPHTAGLGCGSIKESLPETSASSEFQVCSILNQLIDLISILQSFPENMQLEEMDNNVFYKLNLLPFFICTAVRSIIGRSPSAQGEAKRGSTHREFSRSFSCSRSYLYYF